MYSEVQSCPLYIYKIGASSNALKSIIVCTVKFLLQESPSYLSHLYVCCVFHFLIGPSLWRLDSEMLTQRALKHAWRLSSRKCTVVWASGGSNATATPCSRSQSTQRRYVRTKFKAYHQDTSALKFFGNNHIPDNQPCSCAFCLSRGALDGNDEGCHCFSLCAPFGGRQGCNATWHQGYKVTMLSGL